MRTSLPANILGALLAFGYFQFIDPRAVALGHRPSAGQLLFFVVGTTVLIAAGNWLGHWLARPLSQGLPAPGPGGDKARRLAVQLPWVMAGITLLGWVLAGLIWGVLWFVMIGTFEPQHSVRMIFGITFVAGSAATAYVFFATEHQWRRRLPDLDLARFPCRRSS